jgi:hypothetical protein
LGDGVARASARIESWRFLPNRGAGLKLTDGFEHFGEIGFANFTFEFLLHAIEGGDDAQGASLAVRLEREEIGARVMGIDFALQEALGFKRRDAVAEVAARGGEGFGQLRGLDLARRLKEESGEDESFKKAEAVGREDAGGEGLETPRRAVDGEHGTFAEKSVDAHGEFS